MINSLRLFYFDNTKGNSTALRVLIRELGWGEAFSLAIKLKWRLFHKSPFSELNRENKPSEKAKLSQRQMGPLVVLYELLTESGHSQKFSLELLQKLGDSVATAFLKFNVPIIKREDYGDLPRQEKMNLLTRVTQRFFNADAELSLDDNDNFGFQVNHCHFASYSKALNYPELAPLFCSSDKLFFNTYQDDITFFRSQTLAENNKPCDFNFTWK